MTAEELADKYPIGAELRFVGGSEISRNDVVVACGTITGPPLLSTDEKGRAAVYVPAWVVRGDGREPTTVLVFEGNVIAVVAKPKG